MSSDLLLDFSDTPDTPSQNGTVQSSDPFDPFAPISGDSNSDIQQTNGATDPFDPLAMKSSDTNPLYELEHGDNSNPLYEMDKNGHMDQEDGDPESPREVERTEETYTEEDGTVVTITTVTKTDADGNTITEVTESRMTEEGESGEEDEVVVETYDEVIEEGSDDEPVNAAKVEEEHQRRQSVSSEEGEPYGQGVTMGTVYAEKEEDRKSVSSDEGEPYGQGVTMGTVYAEKEEDGKSVSSNEGEPYGQGVTMGSVYVEKEDDKSSEDEGEPYGSGVTMSAVKNEPEGTSNQESDSLVFSSIPVITVTDSNDKMATVDSNDSYSTDSDLSGTESEYEDGQEYAGSETDSHQSAEKGRRLDQYAEEQYEEYKPPKRVEKTESNKKDTGPQYTIMSEEDTSTHEEGMPSGPTYARKTSSEAKPVTEDKPKDVAREHDSDVTGDDKVDDGIDNCPKLGNLKSRFEQQKAEQEAEQTRAAAVDRKAPRVRPARTKPAQEAPVETVERMDEELLERMEIIDTPRSPVIEEEPEVPRDPNVARETKEKEEVHFSNLGSFKNKFEQKAQESPSVPTPSRAPRTRKSLTTDESKPAPPVVNRTEDGEESVEDLPAAGTSKNLVAKFKSMETSTPPKPSEPRKITPPRDNARPVSEDRDSVSSESERIRAADKKGEVVEEELPPTGTARNLFAKFHEMESTSAPPPTPERKTTQQKKVRHGYGYNVDLPKKKVDNVDGAPRVSPERLESGEFENTPEVREDVAREHDFSYEMHPEGGEFENTPEVRADLVREEDRNIGEELPEEGMAKSLLAKFKNLESNASQQKEYKPSGIGNKATPTPLRPAARVTSREDVNSTGSDAGSMTESQHSLGGEYESTPQHRTDVLREGDHPNEEEELPEEGMAKNLLAKFKSIEKSSPQIVPLPKTPKKNTPKKTASTHSVDADSGIYENEPARGPHNEPKLEGGEFENTPEHRPDVVREQDYNDEEELPEEGTTKNLLARFKAMQK